MLYAKCQCHLIFCIYLDLDGEISIKYVKCIDIIYVLELNSRFKLDHAGSLSNTILGSIL